MKAILCLLLLVVVAFHWSAECNSSSSSSSRPSYEYSISDLNRLYNARVTYAERFKRPLASSAGSYIISYLADHSGVKVTLDNGQKFLVHKGNEYGTASETVVVDARHMSSVWSSTGERKHIHSSTVGDYVRAGGKHYDLFSDNCHHASERMMQLD